MSELVNINPAIGLTQSDTWDPPPPVEYGRSFNFGGTNLGDNGTVGQAAAGSYVLTLPDWLGDPPAIDEYEVYYEPYTYTKFDTQYNCDGSVATSAQDWYASDSHTAQRATVTTATIPTAFTFEFTDWQNSYSCTGTAPDVVTAIDAVNLKADNVSVDIYQQNKVDEFLDPGLNPAGIPTQIQRKQLNLIGSIRVELRLGGQIMFQDYIRPSQILIP